MRLFIGIEIPDMPKIVEFLELLKNTGASIKLVEPYNIHITLLFLGEVDNNRLEDVKDSMKGLKFGKFNVTLKGLGAFPSITKPRVVWLGITEGKEQLRQIRETIYNELLKRKIRPEDEKDFVPHLTLGRIKDFRSITNLIDLIKDNATTEVGKFEVNSVILFKSTLTPKGPIYDKLFEVKSIDRGGSINTNQTI
ncbi:2'-5' RNA ligase [Sulfolobus sp. A20]|uniref:RNA 2',3'-cyclic phosphodiesterase n=1 Tax=Sulfolobaceae TaxID=118883 RepID=UPI0008460F3D|nr:MULTISPECIES: RNA 2',3'-cyclic phosphodiesterase [unclassified Sulfolobus]TRM75241.1 RNA 2',3'-cyclic phosphodiesterase [Sulfolobus sp. E5]TRM77176.1 RNA 2',3'-cyclic phosphodiesterase [Sulfolobus sp. A20-N-F8]TRM77751.1 RNA 2',3'-cyclic phosphodiesterase [Sulfolobus sp. B5]TRM82605.1 RNA 2',3'-cyclic phosphodiesterase [Sulfolobus sp. A20-N-F6]TRM87829.1 RNA 2',3'-cyclic phosphodiesterase [Sulfolobus sp. C3]TRM99461.1 RNA 2',3'-cyclic phosphodiesterase [Sulfolobus sp. E1]TRN02578.1 RNA 2'